MWGTNFKGKIVLVCIPDAGIDGDVGFVAEVTVRLLHVQIKVASFRLVSQIIPVDSILHFWLKNGLTGSTTNDIEMSPDIWNLNTLGFVTDSLFSLVTANIAIFG